MSIITLSANDTHAIPLGGYLRIDAFAVGAGAQPVRVSVTGEQLQVNTASDACVFLMSCPQRASIIVAPAAGGEFGPDQSLRVTITRSGASDQHNVTIEFPLVRVDGVSEKIIGEISNSGEQYLLTAYGSDESTNLGRESMVVLSSLRSRMAGASGVSSVLVCADASATATRLADPRVLSGAANMIVGLATALALDEVRVGQQPATFDRLSDLLSEELAGGATRIGSGRLPRVSDDTLVIHLTPAPRASMVDPDHPSLVLAYGPTAGVEKQLFELNTHGARAGYIALDDDLLQALEDGNAAAISSPADTLADVLTSTGGNA
ncbi:MAG: hypothetical protein Q4G50_02035 [Corynebacterium sp.]|uniref:hypothetical protein n=1 Tax=Corynebacterium sp. TaxID=1720 RepID=UPI0026E08AB6|nr:hypothetical protein [Corynebacterium sp.]MDO5668762.1 hypothetical protein [Corynebacterium sp.]